MSLLCDERKVRRYIENDEPCPAYLIFAYYLKCKRHGTQVPAKIEAFIDAILEEIVRDCNHGQNTDFNKLFGFKKIIGRKKSKFARENRALLVGSDYETLREEGKTHEDAVRITAKQRTLGEEVVKKSYADYKKIKHSLDGFDTEEHKD